MDSGLTRKQRLEALGSEQFDVLVVGGGIVGAGVARDAALRGLRVALVDKGDYASGTSSKSSKLVHGGLRYLEHFQFGLVFESLRERRIQRQLNPHLVWHIPFVFPVYRQQRVSLLKINTGMWLYDILALFRVPKLHRRLSAASTLEQIPGLSPDGLVGAVHYYDCGTDDARLTLANVLSAGSADATVTNYVRFDGLITDDGTNDAPGTELTGPVRGARLTDSLSGMAMNCSAHHVIFCGGPWTDALSGAHGDGRLLRRTKGVHIVISRDRLPLKQVAALGTADGRVAFAIPFYDCLYIGTTDTDFDGSCDELAPTVADVDYLLEAVNTNFPAANLSAQDVRSTWTGLRPLVADDASDASSTSREHIIETDKALGVTTVAGGKLTTYRAMAEEVLDSACQALKSRLGARRPTNCVTKKVPLDPKLPPAPPTADSIDADVIPNEAAMLWRHHGSKAQWVVDRVASHPDEGAKVVPSMHYVLAQVTLAVLWEHAETLSDVFVRRLQVFYRAPDQGLAAAQAVAEHMARLLGRDDVWVTGQLQQYRDEVALSRRGTDRAKQTDAA